MAPLKRFPYSAKDTVCWSSTRSQESHRMNVLETVSIDTEPIQDICSIFPSWLPRLDMVPSVSHLAKHDCVLLHEYGCRHGRKRNR